MFCVNGRYKKPSIVLNFFHVLAPSTMAPLKPDLNQWLSNALDQQGPDSLPYSEDAKLLIRSHLISLHSFCPALLPRASVFTHDDGRSVNLLKAGGTIPISYHGCSYNVPVSIWLLETYPRHPPLVLLNPTPNMRPAANHPYADQNYSVHVPYLRSWTCPSSNLVDLVRSISHLFGKHPPLYTRRSPPPTASALRQQQRPATTEDLAEGPVEAGAGSSKPGTSGGRHSS